MAPWDLWDRLDRMVPWDLRGRQGLRGPWDLLDRALKDTSLPTGTRAADNKIFRRDGGLSSCSLSFQAFSICIFRSFPFRSISCFRPRDGSLSADRQTLPLLLPGACAPHDFDPAFKLAFFRFAFGPPNLTACFPAATILAHIRDNTYLEFCGYFVLNLFFLDIKICTS